MIKEFIERWERNKLLIRDAFIAKRPTTYEALVTTVVRFLGEQDSDNYKLDPDPDRIHRIDDGDYQGTILFVIADKGYQPSTYFYVKVAYGSCSGCDTLQAIHDYSEDNAVTPEQADKYMTLALHVVQGLKQI